MLELFKKLTTLPEIESFIQGASSDTDIEARENSNIEYKEANQKFSNTNEIGKDVSAFANSEGGLIFYGVKCDPSDPTKPQAITGLDAKNIETFDRVVNSSIHYPVNGLKKKLIPDHNPQVMLVYVPQSDESPHQNAGDNKYYVRLGSESKPMPHYLVELYFGKRRRPKLNIRFDHFLQPTLQSFHDDNFSPHCPLHLGLTNSGRAIAKYIRAVFIFPGDYIKNLKLVTDGTHHVFEIFPHMHLISDLNPLGHKVWEYTANNEVIHPGTEVSVARFQFRFDRALLLESDTEGNNPIFEWTTYAEGMERQTGKVILSSLFNPSSIHRVINN
ncbi:MAG: hypothetical protein NPIRA06_04660 [Nitrospirales bacterium]|nr:MAG: hypothetical protein NPIRA06_04660 [Nitrospirales bacterium]